MGFRPYGVADFVWGIDVYGNGTKVNITGPIEHVVDVLEKLNPALVPNITVPDGGQGDVVLSSAGDIRCGPGSWGWKGAWAHNILYEGVPYLKGVQGEPVQGPGPGSCGRVSCSYNSAIWWCNDKKVAQTLPGFATIADCANQLCVECFEDKNDEKRCVGQNFVSCLLSSLHSRQAFHTPLQLHER